MKRQLYCSYRCETNTEAAYSISSQIDWSKRRNREKRKRFIVAHDDDDEDY